DPLRLPGGRSHRLPLLFVRRRDVDPAPRGRFRWRIAGARQGVEPVSAPSFDFRVTSMDGQVRSGILTTRKGEIPTPTFMPVGTQAAVKTLTPTEVEATGARVVLANTYHLWLRPGPEVVASQGGLHTFMKWPHPILTDSGGYQAFSLADRRTL